MSKVKDRKLVIAVRRQTPKATPVFDCYWQFAAERQAIFFQRLTGLPLPWTNDEILSSFKFTNAYRASDRVSQYLIRNVIYDADHSIRDLFFRVVLFKLFNKIETWELLRSCLGELSYKHFRFDDYDAVLTKALSQGRRIYSAAYIMPSGGSRYRRKHRAHLVMLSNMMKDDAPQKLSDCQSMKEAFVLLRGYPMIGDFLAYQYVTDLNYSPITNFSEMEFVVPGPGARSGLHKCFSDLASWSEQDVIRWVSERQEQEFSDRQLTFRSLWGRRLQLIDCQNLFCEVDKYARVRFPHVKGRSQRERIKCRFRPNSEPIEYWFPPKWGINPNGQQSLACKRRSNCNPESFSCVSAS